MTSPPSLSIVAVLGLPEVRPGDDLAGLLLDALAAQATPPRDGDVLVVTQKVVSKAEGCVVVLDEVEPSPLARAWAERWDKDARVVEVVLREARRIVRMERGVLIAETRHGFICANAGVDNSNTGGPGVATLLPPDPDASAERLRAAFHSRAAARVGVVVSDTFGRVWREGQTNVAIGAAGVPAIRSFEGQHDPDGYELRVTKIAVADELAAAAELVMGKLDRAPAALVRGYELPRDVPAQASAIRHTVRAPENDLFR